MIEVTKLNGWLVLTAINRDTGESDSATYALKSVGEDEKGAQRLVATSEDAMSAPEDWEIVLRKLGNEPAEIAPYQELIRQLIKADVSCPGPMCKVTMLGHLLDGCSPEQVAMVKALDPDAS